MFQIYFRFTKMGQTQSSNPPETNKTRRSSRQPNTPSSATSPTSNIGAFEEAFNEPADYNFSRNDEMPPPHELFGVRTQHDANKSSHTSSRRVSAPALSTSDRSQLSSKSASKSSKNNSNQS